MPTENVEKICSKIAVAEIMDDGENTVPENPKDAAQADIDKRALVPLPDSNE